jgi:hypothetical protein
MWPNVAAEWIAFPFRSLEVLGANLGPETGCADLDFCGYLSIIQANSRIVREIKILLIISVQTQLYIELLIETLKANK